MAENSKKNKDKTKEYNFKPGGLPGPGRGNKKPHKIDGKDFWDSTEYMIREALKSQDEGNRLKAANLYMKWFELKSKHEARDAGGSDIIDPAIRGLLGDAVERLLHGDLPEYHEDNLDLLAVDGDL